MSAGSSFFNGGFGEYGFFSSLVAIFILLFMGLAFCDVDIKKINNLLGDKKTIVYTLVLVCFIVTYYCLHKSASDKKNMMKSAQYAQQHNYYNMNGQSMMPGINLNSSSYLDSQGRQICSACYGKGYRICTGCTGLGRTHVYKASRYDTRIPPDVGSLYETCIYCNGSGKETCYLCLGTGYE